MEEGSIEGINQIREQVWEKIGPFAEYMKEKEHTVEERTRMLYEMIVKDDIQERLSEKEQEFATQGDQALSLIHICTTESFPFNFPEAHIS